MGFGRKANIPVVQETTMDTDGIGGDDIMTPPGTTQLCRGNRQYFRNTTAKNGPGKVASLPL